MQEDNKARDGERRAEDRQFTLRRKLEEEKKDKPSTSSPPPPSSSPKENWVSGMGTPLGLCQAWGRCPGVISPPLSFCLYLS